MVVVVSGLWVEVEMGQRGSGSSISDSSGGASYSTCLPLFQGKERFVLGLPMWMWQQMKSFSWLVLFSGRNTKTRMRTIWATRYERMTLPLVVQKKKKTPGRFTKLSAVIWSHLATSKSCQSMYLYVSWAIHFPKCFICSDVRLFKL